MSNSMNLGRVTLTKRLMTIRMQIASRFMVKALVLPSGVLAALDRIRLNVPGKNVDLERAHLISYSTSEGVDIYTLGYVVKGNVNPDAVVTVGMLTDGTVAINVSKIMLDTVDVYADLAIVGTLMAYSQINIVYGGTIILLLSPLA